MSYNIPQHFKYFFKKEFDINNMLAFPNINKGLVYLS